MSQAKSAARGGPCFAYGCRIAGEHELLGLWACTEHYIEALEHSAHIRTLAVGWGVIAQRLQDERLDPVRRYLVGRGLGARQEGSPPSGREPSETSRRENSEDKPPS